MSYLDNSVILYIKRVRVSVSITSKGTPIILFETVVSCICKVRFLMEEQGKLRQQRINLKIAK